MVHNLGHSHHFQGVHRPLGELHLTWAALGDGDSQDLEVSDCNEACNDDVGITYVVAGNDDVSSIYYI